MINCWEEKRKNKYRIIDLQSKKKKQSKEGVILSKRYKKKKRIRIFRNIIRMSNQIVIRLRKIKIQIYRQIKKNNWNKQRINQIISYWKKQIMKK